MSQTRNRIITFVAIIAFVLLLAWSTVQTQQTTCQVCVSFNGRENCAAASGADRDEAVQTARSTACGPIANGMNESIACGNTPPATFSCGQ